MAESEKLSVFLCHSPADKAAIRDLRERLSKYLWIDPWLDEEKLLPGHNRNAEIEKALENAHAIIVGLSKDSVTKEGRTQAEFKYALNIALEKIDGSIFIIPIKLEDLKEAEAQVHSKLKELECEDYFPNKRRASAFDRIVRSLKVRADMVNVHYEEITPVTITPKPSKNKYEKGSNPKESGVVSTAEFPIHEIPFQRNRNFTGRKDILDSIHHEFSAVQSTIPIHAINGMGGIGKTQIAVYYSYEFAKEYDLVYWIRSETDASLTADYEALTQSLQLPVKTKAEQLVYVNIVNSWLGSTDKKWLLVFDNVESQEKIEKLLPLKGNGHILITSQNPNWKELGQDSKVQPFSNEVAKEFLRKRIGEKGLDHSDRLNVLLGGLPLGLEQASAYMTAHGTPIEIYIKLFEEQQSELWKRETPPKEYKSTIMTTWEMAFKEIQETHPAAEQLLSLFSFFGPDDIPISIIKDYSSNLPEELKKIFNSSIELEENLSAIHRYSLAERNGDFISFHRLVQDVIRTRLSKDQATQWVNIAVQIMRMAFPYDEYDIKTWANCAQLLPHAFATANYAENYITGLEEASEIYQKAGEYLCGQAEYLRASEAIERAINIRQEILGTKHEKLAVSLDYLGKIKQYQAHFTEALKIHNQAFQIFQTAKKAKTQQSAHNMYNLGRVFHHLEEFEKARDFYEQCLTIYSATINENHPDVARCLNGLGILFQDQGEFEKSRKYYEDALYIRRIVLEANHPDLAMSLNDLGIMFKDKGMFEKSREYLEESLLIRRGALGENHPDTAMSLNNLGVLASRQGELENAQKYYEQAYAVVITVFGENHPYAAATLNNIGLLLSNQSKYVEARRYLEMSLSINEKIYGVKHHELIVALKNLARVMINLKIFPLARQYADRAAKICSEATAKYKECEGIDQLEKSIPSIGKPKGKKKKN
jgi:tetratricopeptide (TPR) repeat protein